MSAAAWADEDVPAAAARPPTVQLPSPPAAAVGFSSAALPASPPPASGSGSGATGSGQDISPVRTALAPQNATPMMEGTRADLKGIKDGRLEMAAAADNIKSRVTGLFGRGADVLPQDKHPRFVRNQVAVIEERAAAAQAVEAHALAASHARAGQEALAAGGEDAPAAAPAAEPASSEATLVAQQEGAAEGVEAATAEAVRVTPAVSVGSPPVAEAELEQPTACDAAAPGQQAVCEVAAAAAAAPAAVEVEPGPLQTIHGMQNEFVLALEYMERTEGLRELLEQRDQVIAELRAEADAVLKRGIQKEQEAAGLFAELERCLCISRAEAIKFGQECAALRNQLACMDEEKRRREEEWAESSARMAQELAAAEHTMLEQLRDNSSLRKYAEKKAAATAAAEAQLAAERARVQQLEGEVASLQQGKALLAQGKAALAEQFAEVSRERDAQRNQLAAAAVREEKGAAQLREVHAEREREARQHAQVAEKLQKDNAALQAQVAADVQEIAGLKRQVSATKAQAQAAAAQLQQLQEAREHEAHLHADMVSKLEEEKGALQGKVAAFALEIDGLKKQLESAARAKHDLEEQLGRERAEWERQAEEHVAVVKCSQRIKAELEAQVLAGNTRVTTMEQQLTAAGARAAELEERLSAAKAEAAHARKEHQMVVRQLGEAQEALGNLTREVEDHRRQGKLAEAALAAHSQREKQVAELSSKCSALEKEHAADVMELKRSKAELQAQARMLSWLVGFESAAIVIAVLVIAYLARMTLASAVAAA